MSKIAVHFNDPVLIVHIRKLLVLADGCIQVSPTIQFLLQQIRITGCDNRMYMKIRNFFVKCIRTQLLLIAKNLFTQFHILLISVCLKIILRYSDVVRSLMIFQMQTTANFFHRILPTRNPRTCIHL